MRIFDILLATLILIPCVALSQSAMPKEVLTERLHRNGSLYEDRDHGESLRAKAKRTGTAGGTIHEYVNHGVCPACAQVDTKNDPRIKRSSSDSDVVAIGRIVQVNSELTPNEAFIFSDAQFIPDLVWLQSSDNSSSNGDISGKELTVTFPGGTVDADGHRLEVQLSTEPALQPGHTYLLFLKYLPKSNSYSLIDVRGFDLTGPRVLTLREDPDTEGRPIMDDKRAFIEATQESVNRARLEIRR